MLPAAYRLRATSAFSATTRKGKRVAQSDVVLHFLAGDSPRVGYIVSKAVGGSVTRHAVARRLRAATAQHLSELPDGNLVVRALPSAAQASVSDLSGQLERALGKLA